VSIASLWFDGVGFNCIVRAWTRGLDKPATLRAIILMVTLTWFPGGTRAQVEAVLEHAERGLAVA